MAVALSTSEIQNEIMNIVRNNPIRPRAGEIAADITKLQMNLDRNHSVRAIEYEKAVNGLLNDDFFTYKPGSKFLILTEKGFAAL